jgi:hypothetical protein
MRRTLLLPAVVILALSLGGCADYRQENATATVAKVVTECHAPYPPNTHFLGFLAVGSGQ